MLSTYVVEFAQKTDASAMQSQRPPTDAKKRIDHLQRQTPKQRSPVVGTRLRPRGFAIVSGRSRCPTFFLASSAGRFSKTWKSDELSYLVLLHLLLEWNGPASCFLPQ